MTMRKFYTVIGIIALLALVNFAFIDIDTDKSKDNKDNTEIVSNSGNNNSIAHSDKKESAAISGLKQFYKYTGFNNATFGHFIMIVVGLFFIFLAIKYNYEPLLLIPIGVGILIGNIPFLQNAGLKLGIYEDGSVMSYLYMGVTKGIYPPLIFLGIGAMTDFSSLISNPRLMLLGAAAQVGIFLTFIGALALGFLPTEAGAIGIIGGADGPTSIFIASQYLWTISFCIAIKI